LSALWFLCFGNKKQKYRIFSIKRPRRLFQTWHGEPGVSFNQQLFGARHFFIKGYYSFFLAAVCLALNLKFLTTNKRLTGLFTMPFFIPGV